MNTLQRTNDTDHDTMNTLQRTNDTDHDTTERTDPVGALFGEWVEWRIEPDRSGGGVLVAVNHRDGEVIQVDVDELSPRHPRHTELLDHLVDAGFTPGTNGPGSTLPPRSRWDTGIVWSGADRWVRALDRRLGTMIFGRLGLAAQIVLAITGLIAVFRTATARSIELQAAPTHVPIFIALTLVAVVVHELGHAWVTVHHDRHVRQVGMRLHLGTPAFYVESLDAILLPRRQRIIQAAAGPWAEWMLICAAALAFLALDPSSTTAAILQRFVVLNAVCLATNLLPFVGLDGALIFADLCRRLDLTGLVREAFTERGPKQKWILCYAAANAIVSITLIIVAWFFWWQLFGQLITSLLDITILGPLLLLTAALWTLRRSTRVITELAFTASDRIQWLITVIRFRTERTWRVEAITAMANLPALAGFDASDLGIIAGHLRRHHDPDDSVLDTSTHVYLRTTPTGERRQLGRSHQGTLMSVEQYREIAHHPTDAIFLPTKLTDIIDQPAPT